MGGGARHSAAAYRGRSEWVIIIHGVIRQTKGEEGKSIEREATVFHFLYSPSFISVRAGVGVFLILTSVLGSASFY
jgi:hypothetical protein